MSDAHHRAIDETAAIYGFTFVPMPSGETLVAGWLEPAKRFRRPRSPLRLARRRGTDLDVVIWDDCSLMGSEGVGKVAVIRAMCLPVALQRRGFGGQVIHRLAMMWSYEGVAEVQADTSTDAGAVAFKSWGFGGAGKPTTGDFPEWYLSLRQGDPM